MEAREAHRRLAEEEARLLHVRAVSLEGFGTHVGLVLVEVGQLREARPTARFCLAHQAEWEGGMPLRVGPADVKEER